jgi:hypothetical protein
MYKKVFHLFCVSLILSACGVNSGSNVKHQYSSSSDDKRFDDMDSVIDNGFFLGISRVKNDSTKTPETKINKFLWQAAIEELKDIEIISLDKDKGIILTEWFLDKNDKNTLRQIEVRITDNVISPEALNIKINSKNQKGFLSEDHEKERFLEIEILQKARDYYIAK